MIAFMEAKEQIVFGAARAMILFLGIKAVMSFGAMQATIPSMVVEKKT